MHDCVCELLAHPPPFLSEPWHEYTVEVDDSRRVSLPEIYIYIFLVDFARNLGIYIYIYDPDIYHTTYELEKSMNHGKHILIINANLMLILISN